MGVHSNSSLNEVKLKDEVQGASVEVSEEQDAVIDEAEVEEVWEKEKSEVMFKPPDDDGKEGTSEAAVDEDEQMKDAEVEVEGSMRT